MFVGIFLYLQITQKQDSFLIIISHYFRKSWRKKIILSSSYKLSHFEKWYFLPTAVEDERCPKKCNNCNYLFQMPWITSDENQNKKWVGHKLEKGFFLIFFLLIFLSYSIIFCGYAGHHSSCAHSPTLNSFSGSNTIK